MGKNTWNWSEIFWELAFYGVKVIQRLALKTGVQLMEQYQPKVFYRRLRFDALDWPTCNTKYSMIITKQNLTRQIARNPIKNTIFQKLPNLFRLLDINFQIYWFRIISYQVLEYFFFRLLLQQQQTQK